ncbi:MAG: hypothetical protein C0483_12885 [Pirellula sp.]|nr:hypothetical protein [Pirellula sp.]
MNRTPFALFTLLCTLASSIVAAGNASRRAGVDHRPLDRSPAYSQQRVTQVTYLATAESEPAWNAAGWKPVDVRSAYLSLIERLPKSIDALPTQAVKPPFADFRGVSTGKVGRLVAEQSKKPAPSKAVAAPVLTRVASSITRDAAPAAKQAIQSDVRASILPIGSPLLSPAVAEFGWQGRSGQVIAHGGLPTVGSAAKLPVSRTKIRIGKSVSKPGVELKSHGIIGPQGFWTPALHVAESGTALLGSYYAAPVVESPVAAAATGNAGVLAQAGRALDDLIERVQVLRKSSTEQYLALFVSGWAAGQGESQASTLSAKLPSKTQK